MGLSPVGCLVVWFGFVLIWVVVWFVSLRLGGYSHLLGSCGILFVYGTFSSSVSTMCGSPFFVPTKWDLLSLISPTIPQRTGTLLRNPASEHKSPPK